MPNENAVSGWKIIPEELTEEMRDALMHVRMDLGSTLRDNADDIYSALLSASPSDAERHERANDPHAYLIQALREISDLRDSETAEPFDDALDIADAALSAYASPSPPAAVQEPVGVKALDWKQAGKAWEAKTSIGRYDITQHSVSFVAASTNFGKIGECETLEDTKAAAQYDYEQRIRSALSTFQSDPAPEIVALRAENERLRKAITEVRAEFHTDYLGEKLAGVSYGSTALARVVGLLDAAVAHEQEEAGE